MKLIAASVLASLALSSWSSAQAPITESTTEVPSAAATGVIAEEEPTPNTFEDFKAVFSSALPAGETGTIATNSEIKVQEGQVFLSSHDTAKLMESYGNLPDSYHGAITAIDESYFIIFKFSEEGYVKDDEKEELDADDILDTFKDADEESNKQRRAAGLDTLTTVGWAFEPKYNETTNNLEWAFILEGGDGVQTVNHNIKILGRKGVMDATLVCDPDQLEALRPMLDETLANFNYLAGNKYSEFEEGDKIAEYGLKGLILGGGLFAAGKLGLFALLGKFMKQIIIGIVAIGAFFVKMKDKIFSSKNAE